MMDAKTETPQFKLTLRDFNTFYGEWRRRNVLFAREARRLGFYMLLIGAVLLWNSRANIVHPTLNAGTEKAESLLLVIIIGIAALLMAAFLVFIVSPALIYFWQAIRFLSGPVGKYPQSLKVTLEGIEKTVNGTSHTVAWTDTGDLVDAKKTLLIFTSKNSAFIIPKSAFASEEAVSDFSYQLHTFRALGLRR